MVTTRASRLGRFTVPMLEPVAIPTKLDVIIGNRYFQLIFQVEPYLPNIGLQSIWSTQDDGNGDHANGAAKDTEMREPPNNAGNLTSDASGGTAGNNSINGK